MQLTNKQDGTLVQNCTKKECSFRTKYSGCLIDFAVVLGQQNDFAEILRIVSQKAEGLLHADSAFILMVNPRTHQTVKTVHKEGVDSSESRYQVLHNQLSGWIMHHHQSLSSPNIKKDPRFSKVRFGDIDVKAVIGVPLTSEDIILGTLILFKKKQSFSEADLTYLQKIAIISAPYLHNVQKIQEYFVAPLPESTLQAKYEKLGLIGKSKQFRVLLKAVEAAARSDVRVLLEGQSGTGKELLARAIHKFSQRSSGPFVAIDCGAIPAHLIESELFGHVRGAFTGANYDRKGLLEEAHMGTIFMDEIANMPADMQIKLMRMLQEGEIRPVGSNKIRKVDVRIITASSMKIQKLVEKQQFREDLFYRLYVYPIPVPTLKERREDIPVLACHFLEKFVHEQGKNIESFHPEILEFMKNRLWTGNIRELENFVERLVTMANPNDTMIKSALLPQDLKTEFKKVNAVIEAETEHKSLEERLNDYEEQIIRKVLTNCQWNQSKAARALSVSEQTIRYKMSKLGIVKPL